MSDFYFDLVRGDTVFIRVPIVRTVNGVSTPVDLTGATVTFSATLALPDAAAPVQSIGKSLGAGIALEGTSEDGVVIVAINPEDTDPITIKTTYRCRVHVEEANGIETTVGKGDIAFAP